MSNEFRRLLDDAPSAELRATLESGLRDQPSPRTLGRAARALGIGAAGIGSARAAAAAGGLRAARAPLWGALAKLGATGVLIGGVALSPLVLSTRPTLRQSTPAITPAASSGAGSNSSTDTARKAAAPVAEASSEPAAAAARTESLPGSSAAPSAALIVPSVPSSVPRQAVSTAVRPARAVQPVVSAPTASVARGSASTTAESGTPTKPRADFLDSEVSLLDAARTALKRNDPNAALLQLNRHAQLAGATLGAEATLLRVQALVLSGRSAEARDVARAALNGKNGGPYAERLRKISGLNE